MLALLTHILNIGPGMYEALGFVIVAFLEEVVAPIPLPVLFLGSTFFFKAPFTFYLFGKVILFVALPITIGATLGSIVIYFLAYQGGKPAIIKFKKYIRVTWEDVEKFQAKLSNYRSDEWILFISRAVPFLPSTIIAIIAGLIRMNPWKFIAITFFGIFVRVLGLLLVIDFIGQAVFMKFFNL